MSSTQVIVLAALFGLGLLLLLVLMRGRRRDGSNAQSDTDSPFTALMHKRSAAGLPAANPLAPSAKSPHAIDTNWVPDASSSPHAITAFDDPSPAAQPSSPAPTPAPNRSPAPMPAPFGPGAAIPGVGLPELERLLGERLRARDLIGAVKLVRNHSGSGLKEAKDAVERFAVGDPGPLRSMLAGRLPIAHPAQVEPGRQLTDQALFEALSGLLAQGQKIQAVKLLRDQTGATLKDAVEALDDLSRGNPGKFGTLLGARVAVASATASVVEGTTAVGGAAPGLDDATRHAVLGLIAQQRKIEAIKIVRERLGLGLKEAKDLVERL